MEDNPDYRIKLHPSRFSKQIKTSIHRKIKSVSIAVQKYMKKKENSGKKEQSSTEKEAKNEPTLIDKLNDDCLIEIFMYLPIEKRLEMEEVCVRWQNVSKKTWHNIRKLEFLRDGYKLSDGSTPSPDFIEKVLMRCGVYLNDLQNDVRSPHMLKILSKHCRNLTTIDLNFESSPDFRVKDAKALSALEKLQSFKLIAAKPKFLIKCLLSLPKTVKSIHLISQLWMLENLNSPNIFQKFDALDFLKLEHYDLGIDLIKAVSNMQTITKLSLYESKIKKGFDLLLNMSNLEYLDLTYVENVNDIFLNCLSTKCQKLKYLNVSRCKGVRDEGIMELIRNYPDLQELDVADTSISEKTLQLAISVTKDRKNSVILKIILDGNFIDFYWENKDRSPFLRIDFCDSAKAYFDRVWGFEF